MQGGTNSRVFCANKVVNDKVRKADNVEQAAKEQVAAVRNSEGWKGPLIFEQRATVKSANNGESHKQSQNI